METENDWSSFVDKDLTTIDEQGGSKIFQLLKLSYDYLPFHLKKCFAFCSLFPKDYEMNVAVLIRHWVANGFVQSSDQSACLEDIGYRYFMSLAQRSFFQELNMDDFGGYPQSCKMHDIKHELAKVVSGKDCVIVNKKEQHIYKQTRHLCFGFTLDSSGKVPSSLGNAHKLRTLILFKNDNEVEKSTCDLVLSSFKELGVLGLNNFQSGTIPSCISLLKHLRYLNLSYSEQITVLPDSIANLTNLETLLLNWCLQLKELPRDLWKLISLRHVELDGCFSLSFMPPGIGQLTNLQTLTKFVLGSTSKGGARASELSELNNLRGELRVSHLQHLRPSPTEAKEMNLIAKPHLRRLDLCWTSVNFTMGDKGCRDLEKDDIIMQGLQLHPNIKVLNIHEFGGVAFSSLANSFTNLSKLSSYNCLRLQYLPQLHVKSLRLMNLPCLEWIVNDDNNNGNSSTFSPSLTNISIVGLSNLKGCCRCNEEELQMGCCHQQFKSLDCLSIIDCLNLNSFLHHTNIKKVELYAVREVILHQLLKSKVESLYISRIDDLKSLSGVLQHDLTALTRLDIMQCEELDPCNDETGCDSLQWKQLKSLKYLKFERIPKMKYLPEGLQHVTTLRTLRIKDCACLTFIPKWATSVQVVRNQRLP